MFKDINEMSSSEIREGYTLHNGVYTCHLCKAKFEEGQVYPFEDCYFDAKHAIQKHIEKEHENRLEILLSLDSKYVAFTNNQKELLLMMASGLSDNEIAKKANISMTTVRNQRFQFREKAKQAKMYLAIYELAQSGFGKKQEEQIVDVHFSANQVDDRFVITKEEEETIKGKVFKCLDPLILAAFPAKQKKKIVILNTIIKQFEMDKQYEEKEVNAILKAIYDDYVSLRRYLIEYGYLDRSKDGSQYWVK